MTALLAFLLLGSCGCAVVGIVYLLDGRPPLARIDTTRARRYGIRSEMEAHPVDRPDWIPSTRRTS